MGLFLRVKDGNNVTINSYMLWDKSKALLIFKVVKNCLNSFKFKVLFMSENVVSVCFLSFMMLI